MSEIQSPSQPRKKRQRIVVPIVIIVVVVLIIVFIAVRIVDRRSATSGLLTSTVTSRTVSLTAQGTGGVVDHQTVAVSTDNSWTETERDGVAVSTAAQTAGGTVTSVEVKVGTHVYKGKVLAKVKSPAGTTTTITSPVSGYIRSSAAVKNSSVAGTLFTIGAGSLQVSVPISEYDIGSVAIGQTVSVDLQGLGETKTGTVLATSPLTSGSSSTSASSTSASSTSSSSVTDYDVIVSLPNPSSAVRVGMNAQATIQIKSVSNVLAIPVQALNSANGGKYTVTVVGAKGRESATSVTVGLVGDTYAEITSGLSTGDTIVTGSAAASTSTRTTPAGPIGSRF